QSRALFVNGAVRCRVFVDFNPNPKRSLDSSSQKTDGAKRGDTMAKQFEQRRCGPQACRSKVNRQKYAMQKPRGNRGRAQKHTGISREQHPKKCRARNEQPGNDADGMIDATYEKFVRVNFECDACRNCTRAESQDNPRAD